MTKDSIESYNKAVSEAKNTQEQLTKILDDIKATREKIAEIKTDTEQMIAALEASKKNLQVDKDTLKSEIAKLTDLNKAQRAGFNEKIDSIDAEAANKSKLVDVVTEAKETDKLMKKVKDLLADDNGVDDSTNFKEADKDKQDAYKEAIKKAIELIAEENKPSSDKKAVENVINKVEETKKALNGETALKADKQEVKNKIKNELMNLNKAQKESLRGEVNKVQTRAEVKEKKEKAIALNTKMGELKKLVSETDSIVKTPKYTNADGENKKEFDEAMKAAKELVDKDSNINANRDQVDLMMKALTNARNSLNGKDNPKINQNELKTAKEKAVKKVEDADKNKIAEINKTDADKSEKDKAIAEVEMAKKDAIDKINKTQSKEDAMNAGDKGSEAISKVRVHEKQKPKDPSQELVRAKENAKADIKNVVERKKKEVEKSASLTRKAKDKAIKEIDEAGIWAMENIEKAKDKAAIEKARQGGLDAIAKVKVGKDMGNKKPQPIPQPKPENRGNIKEKDNSAKKETPKKKAKSPKTGDEGIGATGLLTLLGAAGIAGTIRRKDEK